MSDRLIFQSPIYKIQKCEYTAHACIVNSYEDAKEVMAHISIGYSSAHCAPYAIRLIEDNGEINEIYEDLGEFLAGNTLMAVLRTFENIYQLAEVSVMVMITRKVYGCFVTDMIQHMKYNAIRTCASKALTKLNKKMFHTSNKGKNQNESEIPPPVAQEKSEKKEKRNPLPTSAISFDSDTFKIPPIPQKSKAERASYRPGHFRDGK